MCRYCGYVCDNKDFKKHLQRKHEIERKPDPHTLKNGEFVEKDDAVWAAKKEHDLQVIEDPLKYPDERAAIEQFCWEMLGSGYKVPYRWQRYGQPGYRKLFERNGKTPVLYKWVSYQYYLILYCRRQDVLSKDPAAASASATATAATQTDLSGIQYDHTFYNTCKSLIKRDMDRIQRNKVTIAQQERVLLEQRRALNKLKV